MKRLNSQYLKVNFSLHLKKDFLFISETLIEGIFLELKGRKFTSLQKDFSFKSKLLVK